MAAPFRRICDKCCEPIDWNPAVGYTHLSDGSPLCEDASPEIEFAEEPDATPPQ